MANAPGLHLFRRKSLDEITRVPDDIISVYVVENHIWAGEGSEEARRERRASTRTVEEFLITPVRPFLNDIFRQMAAPYERGRRDNPVGQGYWIQAEFGSGKSHLLSFIGALALGGQAEWEIVRQKEQKEGLGKRESLYGFYEGGIAKKSEGKGVLVAVKTLVGQGGGAIGVQEAGRPLTQYVLDAVAAQFFLENGRSLPLYPTEILAKRFLTTGDFDLYRRRLAEFLKDPAYFDEEEQEEIEDFLNDLQNNPDPGVQRDCGQRLWDFYTRCLQTTPRIPMETEEILKHMVEQLLDEGYSGLLLILDEVSLFMQGRTGEQRAEDEKALVVLSNRLAKVEFLPVWTVCAAQQAIQLGGTINIIARERLDLIPLLNKADAYFDIALARVREVTDQAAVDQYYEDYKRSFSWPQARGKDEFSRFFPFYPPSLSVVREVSMHMTTMRSALYFMLQTLKTQRKRKSRELITIWSLFDDVVEYEEDPSGTTRSIASIKTKWPDAWRAYEKAKDQLNTFTHGLLMVYRRRCEKILKTLFLYHVADMAPNGLGHEELMNAVMEWKDHDGEQRADLQDNLDHYENLTGTLNTELAQVVKVGNNYRFNPTGAATDPREHYQKARAEAAQSEIAQQQAWEALLALDGWKVGTRLLTLDLAPGLQSIFRGIAPSSQTDIVVKWHGREVTGRVFMRDLLDVASRAAPLASINSSETGLDYAIFISSTPAVGHLPQLVQSKNDPRVIFWSPDDLAPTERNLLIDLAAYRSLVAEFSGRDTQEAKDVLDWVQARLAGQMGSIYRIVPDSFGRGRIASLDHAEMQVSTQGELGAILTPLVGQVLDATYVCSEMQFDAPAPFNDTNAINVINGIVRVGEIPRGAKPNKDISAAQNYGFALRIMRHPNDRKLDLTDCRYTRDLARWIEDKLGDSSSTMAAATVYKNFMGIGGPGGVHYGLSKRMVQLYLLCLVREGKIRLTLSRGLFQEAIDYSNIAATDFKTAMLDAFDQIQRLQPPEGWEVLAPFAAVLLQDDSMRQVRQDSDIQAAVQRLLSYRSDSLKPFQTLRAGLAAVLGEVGAVEALEERLSQWELFLSSAVETAQPLPFLRSALNKAFGYPVYPDDSVRQEDIDDLAARRVQVEQVRAFYEHRDRVLAASRYARFDVPDQSELAGIRRTLERVRGSLQHLDQLIESEARLRSEFLEPAEEAMRSYAVRYLQLFDQVTAHAEQVRQQLEALPQQPAYRALGRLARVEQLGADLRPRIQQAVQQVLDNPAQLSPTTTSRAEVERELRSWPQPPHSDLTFQNGSEWIQKADDVLSSCQGTLHAGLLERATLLYSDALGERLAQGRHEPFIAGLLDASSPSDVAEHLVKALGTTSPTEPDPVDLLIRYLMTLRVRKLRLADFRPSKRTLERGDVEQAVSEFRDFLTDALQAGEGELPVVEVE